MSVVVWYMPVKKAERLGAQASLQVVPYYNKPTQEGLYHHFRAIAESCGLPIILYNVPGRTVADLAVAQEIQVILRLYETPLAATATQLDPRTIPRLSRIRCL